MVNRDTLCKGDLSFLKTRSSATADIACDAWNGHSRSLKVICCCTNRCGIYGFLLALNSNLTSIFNCSLHITSSLHLSVLHLCSRWNWKKTPGCRWTCFGVRVPIKLAYPTINLNLHHMITMHAHPRRSNNMVIARRFVLIKASCANKSNSPLPYSKLDFPQHRLRFLSNQMS